MPNRDRATHAFPLLLACGLLAALVPGSSPVRAAPGPRLLTCETPSLEWKASVSLDESGRGKILVEHEKGKLTCALTLAKFSYLPQAEVPSMDFVFMKGACQGDAGTGAAALPDSEVLGKIPLHVRKENEKEPPTGTLQWRQTREVTSCRLVAFDKPALKSAHERWRAGNWGK